MGFEPSSIPFPAHDSAENKAIRETTAEPNTDFINANPAIDGQAFAPSNVSTDPIEAALAKALEGATAAGEWSTVAQLARELEERRKARAGVVDLTTERMKRNGGAQ
jgi:hypothetical protein